MASKKPQTIRVIGIPMDLGQKHRGVDMGPSALRHAGLDAAISQLGYPFIDAGNIAVPLRYTLPSTEAEDLLPAISQACQKIYEGARLSILAGELPIFLGGDHSIAIGTIGGVSSCRNTGVIWIDAHGDFNTPETTTSGNIHGMPLAVLLGQGYEELVSLGRPGPALAPENIILLGIRELDPQEKELIKRVGCRVYTMRDIDERGIKAVMGEALAHLAGLPSLHISLDLDALDPDLAPGVGTRSRGGLTYREAQLLMELIADSGKLSSVDLVEINPILDRQNQTATVAVQLLASLLGKSIL